MKEKSQTRWANITFGVARVFTSASDTLKLPVISTGRPFAFYREVFFGNRSESEVLEELRGKTILDVGCGLTPFTKDSMFQACHSAGIDFYGVDPKLAEGLQFGAFDRLKIAASGGEGMDSNAPGEDHRLGIYSDDLPFDDGSVDLILSSWALFVWITDPQILESVFAEAARVLKPGGEVRIYPTPPLDKITKSFATGECLETFDVRQLFLGRMSALNVPPAFRTTFTRK